MTISSWNKLSEYQPAVGRILFNSFRHKHLAHAYILEGPLGTKRIDTALWIAKVLLCRNIDNDFEPCGVCHNCRRVDQIGHPNLFFVQAEGETIKKRQIMELLVEFSRASVEPGPRIYIIDEAEKFNQEAANTLLKTMEDPGADIYQIMITSQINALLKTIVSRAQVIHFRPVGKMQIHMELANQGFSPLLVDAVSEYTTNTDKAREMVADKVVVDTLNLALDIFRNLLSKEKSVILMFKDQRDSVFQQPETTDFFLTMLIMFMKDILNYKLRYLDLIVFDTEKDLIGKLSERISQKHIEDLLGGMLDLKSRLKYNINNYLAFDKMLVYLERGFDHGIPSSAGTV